MLSDRILAVFRRLFPASRTVNQTSQLGSRAVLAEAKPMSPDLVYKAGCEHVPGDQCKEHE